MKRKATPQGRRSARRPGPAPLRLALAPTEPAGGGPSARGKYVYGVIRAERPLQFGQLGLGLERPLVSTVLYRGLAAVVSDAPLGVLDPTRENVLAHQRVTERVLREHALLPMSFGTVFKTEDDVAELLRGVHATFEGALAKLEDKLELGLKVLWDREQIVRAVEREDEGLLRLKREISDQVGSTSFARMQHGRMLEAAVREKAERCVGRLLSALGEVSLAARTSRPVGERMILNAAFLVSRPGEAAFDARVKGLAARHPELTFRYTGPWPPYHFVTIRLRLERPPG